MPIRCQSSEVDFNVVVAAALLDGSSTSLSGSSNDALLAAVFQSRRSRLDNDDDDRNVSSALCVYRLSQVRRRFTENIRRCFAGQQNYVGLQFSNRLCVSLVSSHCIQLLTSLTNVYRCCSLNSIIQVTVASENVTFLENNIHDVISHRRTYLLQNSFSP